MCPVPPHSFATWQTAMLERLLAKAFVARSRKKRPLLLKDLIASPLVLSVLGPAAVAVLTVAFGSPLGLNLRNLLWHGYTVAEGSRVPDAMTDFVGLVLAAVADRIEPALDDPSSHMPPDPTSVATDAPSLPSPTTPTPTVPAVSDAKLEREVHRLIDRCYAIPPRAAGVFHCAACQYFAIAAPLNRTPLPATVAAAGMTAMATLVVLLESSLRLVHVHTNGLDRRRVLAQSLPTDLMYVTLAEILSPAVEAGGTTACGTPANATHAALGRGCVELLQDLLVCTHGPRVRDRLSHGEAAEVTADDLQAVMACLIASMQRHSLSTPLLGPPVAMADPPTTMATPNDAGIVANELGRCCMAVARYRSRHHHAALLQQASLAMAETLTASEWSTFVASTRPTWKVPAATAPRSRAEGAAPADWGYAALKADVGTGPRNHRAAVQEASITIGKAVRAVIACHTKPLAVTGSEHGTGTSPALLLLPVARETQGPASVAPPHHGIATAPCLVTATSGVPAGLEVNQASVQIGCWNIAVLSSGGDRQYAPAVTKQLMHLCLGTQQLLDQVLQAWSAAKQAAGPLEELKPRDRLAKMVGLLPVVGDAALLVLLIVRHVMFGCCGAAYTGCLRVDDGEGKSPSDVPSDVLPAGLKRLLRAGIKCTDRSKGLVDKIMWSELAGIYCEFAAEVCNGLE